MVILLLIVIHNGGYIMDIYIYKPLYICSFTWKRERKDVFFSSFFFVHFSPDRTTASWPYTRSSRRGEVFSGVKRLFSHLIKETPGNSWEHTDGPSALKCHRLLLGDAPWPLTHVTCEERKENASLQQQIRGFFHVVKSLNTFSASANKEAHKTVP